MKKLSLLCLLLSFNAVAEECLPIDGARTEIAFEIEQAGAAFEGEFERAGGEVCIGNGNVIRIDAWLDPASANTGLSKLDAALKGEDFFAVEKFPRATFESDDIEKTGDGFIAHGRLTMKGVSKAFDLPFTLEKTGDGYRASGETALQRLEFNVGTGEWADTEWLSDKVTVKFTIIARE